MDRASNKRAPSKEETAALTEIERLKKFASMSNSEVQLQKSTRKLAQVLNKGMPTSHNLASYVMKILLDVIASKTCIECLVLFLNSLQRSLRTKLIDEFYDKLLRLAEGNELFADWLKNKSKEDSNCAELDCGSDKRPLSKQVNVALIEIEQPKKIASKSTSEIFKLQTSAKEAAQVAAGKEVKDRINVRHNEGRSSNTELDSLETERAERQRIRLAIMSSHAKLLKISKERKLQGLVAEVLFECCIKDSLYNKYYSATAVELCESHFRFNDKFEKLFYNASFATERSSEYGGQFFGHLFATGCLHWRILKKGCQQHINNGNKTFMRELLKELKADLGQDLLFEKLQKYGVDLRRV